MSVIQTNTHFLTLDLKKRGFKIPKIVQFDDAIILAELLDDGIPINLVDVDKIEVVHQHVGLGKSFLGTGEIVSVNGKQYVQYRFLGSEMQKTGFLLGMISLFFGEEKITALPFRVEIVTDLQDNGVIVAEKVRRVRE